MRKNTKNKICKVCKNNKVRKVGYFKTGEPKYGCICEACKNNDRKEYPRFKKSICENCGFIPLDTCQLDVDHIDGNHKNNDISNLRTLCANCHRLKTKLEKNKEGTN